MMGDQALYDLTTPVFLIGFMGAGKSSVARKLARMCGVASLDLDAYIERREGRKISAIFKEDGEAAFRALETEALRELAQDHDPLLISCGGGIVVSPENRRILKDQGCTVYLVVDADEAAERISDKSSRPLFNDLASARARLQERVPLYEEVADQSIQTSGKGVYAIARELQRCLEGSGVICLRHE